MGCAQKVCELLVNYLPKQWVKFYSDYSYPFVSESNQVTLMDTSQCHLPLDLVIILVFCVHYKGTILPFAYISLHQGQWGIEISLGTQALYFHQCLGTLLAGQYSIRRCCKDVLIHKLGTATLHDRWLYLCAFINWSLATASKRCPNRICTGGLLWSNVVPFNRARAVLVPLVLWHMVLKEEDVRSFCRMMCQLALVAWPCVADSMKAFSSSEYLMNSESSSKQLLSQNPSVLQVWHERKISGLLWGVMTGTSSITCVFWGRFSFASSMHASGHWYMKMGTRNYSIHELCLMLLSAHFDSFRDTF